MPIGILGYVIFQEFAIFSYDHENDLANLHAKVVVVDRAQALIGSANFSERGLANNYELGMVVSGSDAVEVARPLDILISSNYVTAISFGV